MTIKQILLAVPLLGLGWLCILLAVSLMTDAAPAYIVLLPSAEFVGQLDPDMSILAVGPISITLAADSPRVAARLYSAGARVVLPAGLPGCLPAPATQKEIGD
ncbi:hypothetical protein EBB79_08935 [Parasedimentitalea marina]|uniref:Uncharacterized protein n=1 Tax=Parasedimentitalea marina TaxID=2483033 RepID=A0A3T0N1V4_9RHOB|nr:hypothetical protein [Parasedimentitalea marina]AZV78006.1 hypothetical protein EBB79_08935 [Parasedimentitalea marina]